VIMPTSRWQGAVIAAILVVPLLVLVLLSTPAWLTWPFLNADRRNAVLDFLNRLVEWVRILAGITQ